MTSGDTSTSAVGPGSGAHRAGIDIEVAEVTHRYGERVVLREVSVHTTERRVGVIGANGSGKSTFARLLNGLVQPVQGVVRVGGMDLRSEAAQVRRRVGFVFTDPDAQIVMPTVSEDLGFGLARRGVAKAQLAEQVSLTLDELGLSDLHDHPAHLLSGGQKQLLAFGSVLITAPDLLVCDEPTTLLDLRNQQAINNLIRNLPQSVVLITHHLDEVRDFDRVLVFDHGRLVVDDEPAAAVTAYRNLMAQ